MNLSRVDLADLHAPEQIAKALHRQVGRVDGAIPIVEIARGLDIMDVRLERYDAFEGMLLTDRVRSFGAILANTRRGHRQARFTVAHELGHFLMERHVPTDGGEFRCKTSDLNETRERIQHQRQETQANRFVIAMLAPLYKMKPFEADDPSLKVTQRLRDQLDVSLEAIVRRYVEIHPEPLAAIWSKDGCVRYVTRGPLFPWINLGRGTRLPQDLAAARAVANGSRGCTVMCDVHPGYYIDPNPVSELFEQTRVGQDGHAVTLLWATLPDTDDQEDLKELSSPRFR